MQPSIPLALRSLLLSHADTDPQPTEQPRSAESAAVSAAVSAKNASQAQQTHQQQKHSAIVQMTMHAALRPLIPHAPPCLANTSEPTVYPTSGIAKSNTQSPSETAPSSTHAGKQLSDPGYLSDIVSDLQNCPGQHSDPVRSTQVLNKPGGSQAYSPAHDSLLAAWHFVCHVTTLSQLPSQLPAASRKQLSQQEVLMAIMAGLQQVTDSPCIGAAKSGKAISQQYKGDSGSDAHGKKSGKIMGSSRLSSSQDALLALGNLAELLTGQRKVKHVQVSTQLMQKPCFSSWILHVC